MINTKKGISTILVISITAVIVVVIGILYFTLRNSSEVPIPPTQTGTTSTTTPVSGTSTVQNTSDSKSYTNAILGISFSYPRGFLVKSDTFAADGTWSATFQSDSGDIVASIAKKTAPTSSDVHLQTTSIRIDNREGYMYNVRRDVCDLVIAQTGFDNDYRIEFTFSSCGNKDKPGAISLDNRAISALLSSVKLNNTNTQWYANDKYGFAFRYPIALGRLGQYSSSATSVTLNLGSDIFITAGEQHSTGSNKGLTLDQYVASIPASTNKIINVGGHQAHSLTATYQDGVHKIIAVSNKTPTDLVVINKTGTNEENIGIIVSSFVFLNQ